jgi:cytochrome c
MRNASLRYHVGASLAGMICFLLVASIGGCADRSAQPQWHASAASETPPPTTPVGSDVQPSVASAETANETSAPAAAKAADENVTVGSCDGENTVKVKKELAGQPLADALMDQWKRDHPEANWVTEEKEKHTLQPPADNSDLLKDGQGKGHTYGNYTARDLVTWARETEKFAAEGSRIFHSGDALGSTVGVSCDMCHPHAANTHPETYPKFQPQLGRVALLRDMIDWCIENPVRGGHLDPNGPTMRALEAYIMAQRKGVAMNYGKH